MSTETRFWLNDREVSTNEPSGMLVLDFLRERLRLTGTKEGCREGDCGACTVLIGRLDEGSVLYEPVTSCLMPLGELHGKHLVTIEGLNLERLSPVQQAIVDTGATQCGFCTPGIVVSLTGYLMQHGGAGMTPDGIKYALSGHLCRCTGYRSLKESGARLRVSVKGNGIEALIGQGAIPDYFRQMPARLESIPPPRLPADGTPKVVIAGGTDIYVQRGEALPDSQVQVLNLYPHLRGIRRENGDLRVGALTSFEEFAAHPLVQQLVPDIPRYMFLVASWQIRTRATVGGNIVNASPIGDLTILLLALDSVLVLEQDDGRREIPIRRFFKGYKEIDKRSSEILTEVRIPVPSEGTRVGFEKVSKRTCLDIASVNMASRVRLDRGVIRQAEVAAGGVAPIPLYLAQTSRFLIGKPLTSDTLAEVIDIAQTEISPISDIRGSAPYKRLLVRQLLIGQFCSLFPRELQVEDFYAQC